MKVAPIDEHDVDGGALERFGGPEPSEASADDDNLMALVGADVRHRVHGAEATLRLVVAPCKEGWLSSTRFLFGKGILGNPWRPPMPH